MSQGLSEEQKKLVSKFIETVKSTNEDFAIHYLSICDWPEDISVLNLFPNLLQLAISLYLDSPDYNTYRKKNPILPKKDLSKLDELPQQEQFKEEKKQKTQKIKTFEQQVFSHVSFIKLTIKTETLKILSSILTNIVNHFEEEKFRKVPVREILF
jgi:hypothetical protein